MTGEIHVDDSRARSTALEDNSSPPIHRISALTEAIAMKQSDIAVHFCSMIKRMKCIVENMDEMQNTNDAKGWKMKSMQYVKECQVYHKTATKMAKKQVLLAHQSTKYVERLEQEMLDLQSHCELLQLSRQMSQHSEVPDVAMIVPPLPLKKEMKPRVISCDRQKAVKNSERYDCIVDECSSTTDETMFCIQEISFSNSILIDIAERGATHDG